MSIKLLETEWYKRNQAMYRATQRVYGRVQRAANDEF